MFQPGPQILRPQTKAASIAGPVTLLYNTAQESPHRLLTTVTFFSDDIASDRLVIFALEVVDIKNSDKYL